MQSPLIRCRIGYVPLTDAAPLLAAQAKGFFADQGLAVELVQCASWATLRDRMAFRMLDAAQMLSPMPIAAALGLGGVAADFVVGATLGRNGNTVTLSEELGEAVLHEAGGVARPLPASALKAVLRRRGGRAVFAVVFGFSSHNYLLRYWLDSGRIDPDRDVSLVVVPPPLVAEELAAGRIDGFCAGEPWGSRAVDLRVGRVALTTADIWRDHPEKVLAFTAAAAARGDFAARVIAAVMQAGRWLEMPENRAAAARMLHEEAMPEVPEAIIALGLGHQLIYSPDEAPRAIRGGVFYADEATRPWPGQAAWWLSEMRRWGHAPEGSRDPVSEIWRPDLWQQGADRLNVPIG